MRFTGIESKEELFNIGLEHIQRFCDANGIDVPDVKTETRNIRAYGLFYPSNTIHINMKLCKPPVRTPGYAWTFPGYVQDLTPYGILAHELGHYISDILGKDFRKNFFNIKRIEPNVTSADERGLDEKMAEAARLFITNPDLLRRGRPVRYEIFENHYKPIVRKRWAAVIANAHPKILSAAERWIERGHRKNRRP